MIFSEYFKLTKKILFLVISFFILSESLIVLYIQQLNAQDKEKYLLNSNRNFELHYQTVNNNLNNLADVLYTTVINTAYMREIMQKVAITKDKEQLKVLRKELLEHFEEDYKYMKTLGVRQLHFHKKNSISFLRFHRPKKYGDYLVGVRESIDYVNRTHKKVSCFEEGKVFNGFRNVFPIFKDNVFVGTVEISYSFNAFAKKIQEVDKKISLLFMLRSEIVQQKVFKNETSNYVKSVFTNYSYDKKVFDVNMFLSKKQIQDINSYISNEADKNIREKRRFSQIYDGMAIDFLPIYNLQHKQVAYVIHYKKDELLGILDQKSSDIFRLFSFVAALMTFIVALLLMGSEKKKELEHSLAIRDGLTGIYNRYGLNELVGKKIYEVQRYKRSMSVIFFDIDHFKKINDTYGHSTGDTILEEIVEIVLVNIRESDIFARWGGEEFILFVPETKLEDATKLAEKLRAMIEKYDFTGVPRVRCSFGVAQLRDSEEEDSLLKRVDALLYQAKESGRNRVVSEKKP